MTPEAQRIAIAEACGWKWNDGEEPCYGGTYMQAGWTNSTGEFFGGDWTLKSAALGLPNYLSDLNAMHEAEKGLTQQQRVDYMNHLADVCGSHCEKPFATAAQRAEAFLRTLNLYTSL